MYDDNQDALAAEYVLGTLSADERDQAEAMITIDPGFSTIVRQWERRLGELNVMVEAVEPPPEVWDKIKAEIGSVAHANSERSDDHDNEAPLLPLELNTASPPVAMEEEEEETSPVAALASSSSAAG